MTHQEEEMTLAVRPENKTRINIIATWLDTLGRAEREDALGYLTRPDVYGHQALADALSDELGYDVSEATVRRWRRKHC